MNISNEEKNNNLNNNVNYFVGKFGMKINNDLDSKGFYSLRDSIRVLIMLWSQIKRTTKDYDTNKISKNALAIFKIMTLFDYSKGDNKFFWDKL